MFPSDNVFLVVPHLNISIRLPPIGNRTNFTLFSVESWQICPTLPRRSYRTGKDALETSRFRRKPFQRKSLNSPIRGGGEAAPLHSPRKAQPQPHQRIEQRQRQ
jgi:hypothetical protein